MKHEEAVLVHQTVDLASKCVEHRISLKIVRSETDGFCLRLSIGDRDLHDAPTIEAALGFVRGYESGKKGV